MHYLLPSIIHSHSVMMGRRVKNSSLTDKDSIVKFLQGLLTTASYVSFALMFKAMTSHKLAK